MTMIGEFYILNVVADNNVKMCVFLMIFGAVIAALNDLAFNLKVRTNYGSHFFS